MTNYDRQNFIISGCIVVIQIILLWIGSHMGNVGVILASLAFSFLGLTTYALIHEGAHLNLHSNANTNSMLGTILGWLFPVSFTFIKTAHTVHHLNNRTDSEMFDYYYPEDNLLLKYAQWYSILIGIYPPIIPLGSIILAVLPSFFSLQIWKKDKSSAIIFDRNLFTPHIINKIRLEVFTGIVFWILIFRVLDLQLWSVLIMYMVFWINWSTRQYVTHAFTPRDVINGAWNLKVSRLMGWVFLNGQWDKVHHQHHLARWQDLAELGKTSEKPIAYWPQYFSLWSGPRKNFEPAPKALESIEP